MKITITLLPIISFFPACLFSQTIVLQNNFNNYNGSVATVAPGWYYSWNTTTSTGGGPSFYSSTAYSGVAPNAYKFGGINGQKDTIITPAFSSANLVSFWCRGAGVPYKQQDTLEILESADSISWSFVTIKDSLPTAGTTLTYSLQPTSQYLKFVYHKATVNGGNVAFDDVVITSNVTASPETLAPQYIKVFPSVSNGLFFISSSQSIKQAEIYTLVGKRIKYFFLSETDTFISIELSDCPNGTYFLKIVLNNKGTEQKTYPETVTKKIIINR